MMRRLAAHGLELCALAAYCFQGALGPAQEGRGKRLAAFGPVGGLGEQLQAEQECLALGELNCRPLTMTESWLD
jgi:hypothetical protein